MYCGIKVITSVNHILRFSLFAGNTSLFFIDENRRIMMCYYDITIYFYDKSRCTPILNKMAQPAHCISVNSTSPDS